MLVFFRPMARRTRNDKTLWTAVYVGVLVGLARERMSAKGKAHLAADLADAAVEEVRVRARKRQRSQAERK